ncbi:MAG: MFS transporter [Aestuariibacter sp.]|nr:MFS transporter [Aestuariibacter sp.]
MTKVAQPGASWSDILSRKYASKILTLVLAVWLHASNSMLTSTTMPGAVSEIGGLNLLHWTFSLYLVGSIIAGASISIIVMRTSIRNAMIGAALVYAIGAAIVALAPDMIIVLLGRVLQGLGGGALMGLVYVSQERFFPPHFVPRIIACISMTWMLAAFCGPMIGGAFTTWGIWRMAYWVFAMQALLLAVAIRLLLPVEKTDPAQLAEHIPVVRLSLLAVAIVLVSMAGASFDALLSPLLVLCGFIALVFFIFRDRSAQRSRLLPEGVTSLRHPLGNGVLTIFLLCLCIMSFLVYAPTILIKLHGLSAFTAGLVVMMETVGWGVAAIIFSGLSSDREPALIRSGSALIILGLCGLSVSLPNGPLWTIILTGLLCNAGFGMMWGFIIKRVVGSAEKQDKNRAAALLPMTLQTGFALGAALSGIIANSLGLGLSVDADGLKRIAFWIFAGFIPIAMLGNVFAWRFVRAS